MRVGRRHRYTAVICVFAITGAASWFVLQRSRTPEWRRVLDAAPLIPIKADAFVPVSQQERHAQLFNDVLRRPKWTEAEADFLIAIIDAGFPPVALEKGKATGEEVGQGLVYSVAFDVIKTRYNAGAPINKDAGRRLIKRVLHETRSADAYKRGTATRCLLGTEILIVLPFIRQRVEETALTLNAETQHFVRQRLGMIDEVMAKYPPPPDVQRKLDEMDQIVRSLGG